MQMSSAHAADTEYLVRQAMNTGYQWSSLLVPPGYITYVVARRGCGNLSLNRILRATWVGGFSGAAIAGGGAYVRFAYTNEHSVRAKRMEKAYDVSSVRRNDHATIGGILAAVLTPALFWKSAGTINLVLGGAGIGGAVGLLTHYGRSLSGDSPSPIQIAIPVEVEPVQENKD